MNKKMKIWRRYCAVYSSRTGVCDGRHWMIVEINNPGLGIGSRCVHTIFRCRVKAKETARKWNIICFGNEKGKEI